MLVVEQEHATAPERRGDARGPGVDVPESRERAVAEVDQIPAAEQELRRQGVHVRVHPGQLR